MKRTLKEIMTPEIEATLLDWFQYPNDKPTPAFYIEMLGNIQEYLVWLWATQDIGEDEEDSLKLRTSVNDIIVIRQGLSNFLNTMKGAEA